MQLTMKPYITAGVALAGASVIAVAPVVPQTNTHLPAVSHVQVADVHLTALVNPIDALGNIFNSVFQVVGQTSNMVETTVNPLVRQLAFDANYGVQQGIQLIGNITGATVTLGGSLPGTLNSVLGNLGTLNINGAIDSLVGGLLPGGFQLISGINGPLQGILQQPLAVGTALVPAVLDSVAALVTGLAVSTVGVGCASCLGTTPVVQQVVNSVTGILQSVLTLNPGTIYNGVLNNVVSLVKNIQDNVTALETQTIPYIVDRIVSALNVNPNAPGGVTVPVAAVAPVTLAATESKAIEAASPKDEGSKTAAAAAESSAPESTDPAPVKKSAPATLSTTSISTAAAQATESSTETSSEGAAAAGAEAKGTEAKGTESKGTESKGTESKGTESKGTEAKGSAAKGTESKSSETKGSTAKATESKGSAAKGSAAKDTAAKSTDNNTEKKATKATDHVTKANKSQNTSASESSSSAGAAKGSAGSDKSDSSK